MNFEMLGKLSIGKETEKFKPFSTQVYDSGWKRTSLKFNAVCGDNRHMLQVDAGCFEDGHGDIYTFSKATVNEDGSKKKGESFKIPFKDRLTSKKLADVAEFKKFVFDLEEPGRRFKLKNMAEAIKEGKGVTDEQLAEVGLENESEITKAYEDSQKKHHEFIYEGDFIDFIKKVIDSGKYKDKKFLIKGNGNYSYSEKNERVYENYVPQRIYLAADDAEEYSTANITLLFGSESLDDMSVEEKGKYYVSGWEMNYDSNRKGNIPVPTTITFSAENEKLATALKKKFTVDDDKIYEYGVEVSMLNGAQKSEIDESLLTEEQLEDINLGLITLDDIRKDMGQVYGDRIQEYQFAKVGRGYTSGRKDTAFSTDDMVIKSIVDDATDDLFDDDEDEI
jgi:hypothetical protein